MHSMVNCSVAVLVLSAVSAPLPWEVKPADTAPFSVKRQADSGAGQTFRSGTQAQLARGFEAAWVKAHAESAEDVTTAFDGDDRVTRIRTPLGANLCLNWRDVDRTNPAKGKAVFVLVCNR